MTRAAGIQGTPLRGGGSSARNVPAAPRNTPPIIRRTAPPADNTPPIIRRTVPPPAPDQRVGRISSPSSAHLVSLSQEPPSSQHGGAGHHQPQHHQPQQPQSSSSLPSFSPPPRGALPHTQRAQQLLDGYLVRSRLAEGVGSTGSLGVASTIDVLHDLTEIAYDGSQGGTVRETLHMIPRFAELLGQITRMFDGAAYGGAAGGASRTTGGLGIDTFAIVRYLAQLQVSLTPDWVGLCFGFRNFEKR